MSLIIAIDGPAGSGKGTIAMNVAKKLNIEYLDSGIYYRSIAYLVIKNNIDINDIESICKLVDDNEITYQNYQTYINKENVTDALRKQNVEDIVGSIAKISNLRDIITNIIQKKYSNIDAVIDGRDIGTIIFPNTRYKFYLNASLETRAKRRYEQYSKKGMEISYENIYNSISARDLVDQTRECGSLKVADDAIIINTEEKEIEEIIDEIIKVVKG